MSIVYAGAYDAFATNATTDSDWPAAQGSAVTDGALWRNSVSTYTFGVYNRNAGSRGSNDYRCYRSYFPFALGTESGTVNSAKISIYLDNLGSTTGHRNKVVLVEATPYQSIGGSVADHGNVFASGTLWHDDISDTVVVNNIEHYHDFTLNSDGIALVQAAIDSSGIMYVGLVGWYHDFGTNTPSGGGEYTKIKVTYANYLGTSRDPKLEITYTGAVADNATFFGANF